jgi:hypothetical protein
VRSLQRHVDPSVQHETVDVTPKDAVLNRIAETSNVAQFVSFGPGDDPGLRFARLLDHEPALALSSIGEAVQAVVDRSPEGSVNVRSFQAGESKSSTFLYGLTDTRDVVSRVRELASSGLYTIVNETIDVNDGGVSGVSYAGILEFAPGDTPRAVEKPGTLAVSRELGMRLIETVYGFSLRLADDEALRVEFSIHPLRRGFRHEHTVVWEEETYDRIRLSSAVTWPNRFSQFIGDKTFGLLIAHLVGLRVPRTTVVPRNLAPFVFGEPTGADERWLRTAPREQTPGRFTTQKGWTDPFDLLAREDPDGEAIAAVLVEDSVDAQYSGAAAVDPNGNVIVEGVGGRGDRFMLGAVAPQQLPKHIIDDVVATLAQIKQALGDSRLEWVHDGNSVWVVQLHAGSIPSDGRVIYPGKPAREHRFPIEQGIEALRELVNEIRDSGEGVVLVGNVGITSHLGDILRKARIPSKIASD